MSTKKIIRPVPFWKFIAGIFLAFVVLYLFTLLFGFLTAPDTRPKPSKWTAEELAEAEAIRHIPDTLNTELTIARPVPETDYARAEAWRKQHPEATPAEIEQAIDAGALPIWYPRRQSPLMEQLEAEGVVPSVAERTGPEPVVLRGIDGAGRYGGVWVQLIAGSTAEAYSAWHRLTYERLFRYSPNGYPIVPHLAKSYEVKDGGRVWEVTLRKVRWSDGAPFTSADISYYWYDDVLSPELRGEGTRLGKFLTIGGKPGRLEVLGPHRVRFSFDEPYGDFLEVMALHMIFRPAHYLKKYHPKYADPAFLEAEMKKYGMINARTLYSLISGAGNPELPALSPWVCRRYTTMSPLTYVRNPYYFAVDEQGNQLPYIDRAQLELMDGLMLPLAVANGRASFQSRYLRFEDYLNYASRTKASNFRLLGWIPTTRSEWVLNPNMNRAVVPEDRQSELKAKLLFERDFRQALSVALNREVPIRALYSGYAKPWQVDPGPHSPYPSEKLRYANTEYDPDQANRLLDEVWRRMGLDPAVRKDGYRCDETGKPVTFYLIFTDFTGLGPGQFVIDDWKAVGIRCIYQQCSRSLLGVRKTSRNFDFYVWASESDSMPLTSSRSFVANEAGSAYALGWALWAMRNGMYGAPEANNPGTVPIPEDHPMYRAVESFEAALRTIDPAEKKQHIDRMTDLAAENVWIINVTCAPPKLLVVSNNLRNVPEKAVEGWIFYSPGNAGVETFYFEEPVRSADDDTLAQLRINEKLPPVRGEPDSAGMIALKLLGGGAALLLLAMLVLRHPFVLRRLVIMAPTLLVISICVFTIIQLPPGDYLQNRITQMQESGISQSQIDRQIDELRELFRFDDPAWKRYLRWMGVQYFFSFDSRDAGLLQGSMGYSMENNKSVNALVGDRIMLTILISLGTVILTWSLALPIGIYSACKQYSAGDYLISIIGFLGMCVPSFLLALILMALTGISGLFSPAYAVQPYWDWAKFADMLKHIWVPILVTGVAGTASMIRVMRANLLDELKKPYVTTARAKGVRPVKLLFKYPVRLALNPFISGIGSLFPALVSGSSIVAIVMSLPTVGPMMLGALFSQDMYMAGSMLMILSLLGVFGTLVSDLLLMVVDPRIRIGGGGSK